MDPTTNPALQLVDSHISSANATSGGHANGGYEYQQLDQKHAVEHSSGANEKQQATQRLEPLELEQQQPPAPPTDADDFPGDRGALPASIVLLGAFLTLFPSFGFMVSIGTLQDYWQYHQLADYSSRDIGWIPSVFVYLALSLGICVGPLFDMYGPRWLLGVGSVAYVIMTFLLAECSEYWQFLLCLGFLGGPAGAALTTTSMACVSHWFRVRRGLAAGLAMVGSSFGGVVIPLVLRATLPKYGYAWSMRILGFVFLVCLALGNVLMKARLPPSPDAKKQRIFSLALFGDPAFCFLTASVFGIEIVLFGALGILPTYASMGTDYPPETGFYLIAVMNGVSCLGRIIPGFVSDVVGRFNVFGTMMVVTLVIMLVIWLPFGHTSLAALYIFVAIFGFGTGSWMAMTPACLGQLCGAEHFGRYYGTCYFIASLSTLICIPISGELVQRVGPQPMVGFMCAVLAASIGTFTVSRWACLGWRWKWMAKI
ncbi:putative transporter MCH4 [Cyphellophora attinorum]|uniref:Putative transporter MCH4 n=1 Tax=Cyphellophora attinorum TaxID=1664694 RepID=A0A0N1H5W8_9EURO|nr:putative transporter MCH4 [Phialophora attinorum]KPI36546.1 putative transporter MCH4 [Phialophora attinorum]